MIQKYKVVPPDGGFGYVVVVAVVIINVANTTFAQSYGILFQNVYKELNMGTTSILTQYSMNILTFSISGFATGPLLKKFSLRQMSVLGAAMSSAGSFGTVFAQSESILTLCQSLLSMGSGFTMNTSFTAVNDYFVRKRWLFMTLSQVCPAITSISAPLFLNWSLDYYGQRSTLLLISGFTMQTLVAACLLQPVSWYMRRIPVENVPEKEALMSTSLNSAMINEEIKNDVVTVKDDVVTVKISIVESIGPPPDVKDEKQPLANKDKDQQDAPKKTKLRIIFEHVFDKSIVANFIIMNACLGIALCLFAHSCYILLLPIALAAEDKWDKDTIAMAMTLLGFGDIATKVSLLMFSKFLANIPTRTMYIIGMMIAVVARLGQLWWVNKTVVMCFITVVGISQCTITTLIPHIISEMTDQKQFSAAMGMFSIMLGLLSIVFGPVIGKIRDLSNSYLTVFYILTSIFASVALFWSIEMCYVSNQKKEQARALNAPRKINRAKRTNKRR